VAAKLCVRGDAWPGPATGCAADAIGAGILWHASALAVRTDAWNTWRKGVRHVWQSPPGIRCTTPSSLARATPDAAPPTILDAFDILATHWERGRTISPITTSAHRQKDDSTPAAALSQEEGEA